jgi:3-hexulose-6-phosphate synthase
MALLQVALDYLDLEQATACARAVESEVDIIEVGTPLLKSVGVRAVREMRARFPQKLIFADTKTMDAGAVEARLVFEAGADLFSLCSAASHLTLLAGIREAHERGKKALVDLIGVEDILEAALRLGDLSPDYVCLHTGIDQQQAEGKLPLEGLSLLKQRLGLPLSVAGGITPADMPELMSLEPAIIVVGAYITASAEPARAAREVRRRMEQAATAREKL